MLAISVQTLDVPEIANGKEKDFYRFLRRADRDDLLSQRDELAAALETSAALTLERRHNAVVATMRDRLCLINQALSIN